MGKIYNNKTNTIVNPIDWSEVDKCMMAALSIAPWYFMQAVFGFFIVHNPDLISFIDVQVQRVLNAYFIACGIFWVGMFFSALWLRRNQETNRLLSHITVFLPVPLVIVIVQLQGILMSSVLAGTVAVAMLGFFLFDTRLMIKGVIFSATMVVVAAAINIAGLVPDTPLYQQVAMGRGANWWMAAQILITLYPLFCGILMTMFFLKGLKERESEIRELSRRDGLTKVWNHRYLMEVFEHELEVAKRTKAPLSFMMLDLDFFKKLNDRYGHKMGDRALEVAAEVLQSAVRSTDHLGRYGGEEFAIILPNCDVAYAHEVSERCRSAIETTLVEYNGEKVNLTASVGVTTVADTKGISANAIIERADKALYKSKGSGRNKVSFFTEPVYMNLVSG